MILTASIKECMLATGISYVSFSFNALLENIIMTHFIIFSTIICIASISAKQIKALLSRQVLMGDGTKGAKSLLPPY